MYVLYYYYYYSIIIKSFIPILYRFCLMYLTVLVLVPLSVSPQWLRVSSSPSSRRLSGSPLPSAPPSLPFPPHITYSHFKLILDWPRLLLPLRLPQQQCLLVPIEGSQWLRSSNQTLQGRHLVLHLVYLLQR